MTKTSSNKGQIKMSRNNPCSWISFYVRQFRKSKPALVTSDSCPSLSTMSVSSDESFISEDSSLAGYQVPSRINSNIRRVTFHDGVQAIDNDIELTDQEKIAAWVQPDEYDEYKKEFRRSVKIMRKVMKNTNIDQEVNQMLLSSICTRGCEQQIELGKSGLTKLRRESVLAVLREQDMQVDEGICDPELISITYSECAIRSVERAYRRGLSDEQESLKNIYEG